MSVAHTGLPVEDVIDALRDALGGPGVAVLSAEPGAGKTTVVPLRLLDEPWLHEGGSAQRILVLEPRRIAARAAANRMAALLGERVGETVGVTTRDDRRVSKRTRVEVITEGLLTRRLQRDPSLEAVGLVVFDELHERSLHSDLALALALDSRGALRPDLRILAMSATIDTDNVAAILGQGRSAPVIHASGRQYPVVKRFAAPRLGEGLEQAVTRVTLQAMEEHPGDALVFLPGAREIRATERLLSGRVKRGVSVRPLYGALDARSQDMAIAAAPPGGRKVVLATAIAETSLTVDGVRIVVDAGRARFLQYDQARGMGRLVTATASKASAEQRAGRAGRLSEGVAWRVWDEGLHYQRPDFDRPEIVTADLSAFVLELATWGASVEDLAWLDQPPPESVATAITLLGQLGLLDGAGRVTKRGRQAGALPVHPRLGALVVEAQCQGLGWLGCLAAAALEERDVLRGRPWELPVDLGERVSLLGDPARHHPAAAKGTLEAVRRRAVQLADRASVATADRGVPVTDELGALLAVGYPDRVGQRRSTRGKFLLSSGTGATVASRDPLASESYIVVADLDARQGEAQVRIGAGVDRNQVVAVLGDAMNHDRSLSWDVSRDGLVVSERRMLGALVMHEVSARPGAGDDVVSHVVGHIRTGGLGVLGWSSAASELRDRVGFAHAAGDSSWPAMDDASLLDELESWLAPHLGGVIDGDDLRRVDLHEALWGWLGWHRRRDLDRLLPRRVTLAGGRQLRVDYGRDRPTVRGRVQDFYGMVEGPTIVDGRYPLTLELLSPAGRPVQVTADLAGFWAGSWVEVRKEMAGRYPKHRWPIDPSAG